MPRDRFGQERKTDDGSLNHQPRGGFYACHPSRLIDGIRVARSSNSELRVSDLIPPREVFWIEDDPMILVNNAPINRGQYGDVVDYNSPEFDMPEIPVVEPTYECKLCTTPYLAAEFVMHLAEHSEEELGSWPGGFFDLRRTLDAAESKAKEAGLL